MAIVSQRRSNGARVAYCVTMTLASTSDTPSIFKDGKPRPGIYKIKNFCYGYYLDFNQLSKEVCCRTPDELEDGRGLVRLRLRSLWFVSLTTRAKWEIKNLGIGYTVKVVGLPI